MITLPREVLEDLVDRIVSSMDFGSGFMDDDDVELLWKAADILGVGRWDVTPPSHRHRLCDHAEREGYTWNGLCSPEEKCVRCGYNFTYNKPTG